MGYIWEVACPNIWLNPERSAVRRWVTVEGLLLLSEYLVHVFQLVSHLVDRLSALLELG